MKKVLVGYITHSGSTRDVAEAIAEEINKTGQATEVLPLDQVKDLGIYDGAVIGAPMIVGWHRDALKYLKTHQSALSSKPLALFLTGMSLTESSKTVSTAADIHLDAKLVAAPKNPGRLTFKENFTTLEHYLKPILKVAPQSLKAIGVFGGRLDMYRLKWYEVVFVMLIVGAKPGEKRNWPDIRAWAAGLPAALGINQK